MPRHVERGNQDFAGGVLHRLRAGLVVSCQALPDEPLHGSSVMAQMALAASAGGAAGIRANSGDDIRAIRRAVRLPMIGLVKRSYPDSPVYITPTLSDAEEAIEAGADILALDATRRPRPGNIALRDFVRMVRERWSGPLLADVSTVEEGIEAARMGFELVATTLVGYVGEDRSRNRDEPDFPVLQRMVDAVSRGLGIPVVAEGRIWEPHQARRCLEMGAFAVVVGSAITRPQMITRRFVDALAGNSAVPKSTIDDRVQE